MPSYKPGAPMRRIQMTCLSTGSRHHSILPTEEVLTAPCQSLDSVPSKSLQLKSSFTKSFLTSRPATTSARPKPKSPSPKTSRWSQESQPPPQKPAWTPTPNHPGPAKARASPSTPTASPAQPAPPTCNNSSIFPNASTSTPLKQATKTSAEALAPQA